MPPFGRRLAAIRIDRGLTQQQLGDAIGRSRQTVWLLEHRSPDIEMAILYKLAGALGCRVGDLFAPLEAPIRSRSGRRRRRSRTISNPIPILAL